MQWPSTADWQRLQPHTQMPVPLAGVWLAGCGATTRRPAAWPARLRQNGSCQCHCQRVSTICWAARLPLPCYEKVQCSVALSRIYVICSKTEAATAVSTGLVVHTPLHFPARNPSALCQVRGALPACVGPRDCERHERGERGQDPAAVPGGRLPGALHRLHRCGGGWQECASRQAAALAWRGRHG